MSFSPGVLVEDMHYITNMWTYFSGICRHFRHSSGSLPILQQPICSLSLGSWVPKIGESNGQPFAMLRPNASLSAALSLLVEGDFLSFLKKFWVGDYVSVIRFLDDLDADQVFG